MSSRLNRWLPVALLIAPFAFVLLFPAPVHAATLAGSWFWEMPIQPFFDWLVGPIAAAMILISFAGGLWGFSVDKAITPRVRAMVVMNLCGSILLACKPFINNLFGT